MIRLFSNIIASLLLLSLFGCNDSNGSDNTPPEKVSINAQDALTFSTLDTNTTIDLRQLVHAQNHEPLLISDVKSINGDCDILSVDGLHFNVYTRNADVCRFEYSVKPASNAQTGSAKAVAQVVVNEEPKQGDMFPPISRTMHKNETVSFTLKDLVTDPNKNKIDPNSVVVLNSSGAGETGTLSN
ncbi:hypothetical protein, partial [Photobacterium damselae]|uniref:hypothetical protein n=1 Tax=Photobacterium damselae TaxID=38293 RepID=UPI001EDCB22D